MATGPEHYQAAEKLLASCQLQAPGDRNAETYPEREDGVDSIGNALKAARVHATLALAAATAMGSDQPVEELAGWIEVAGVPRRRVGKPRVVGPSRRARR
ncbi:hypothetical protein [Saccharothrix sp. HUAS TT1]|uniref:hypothetical protein n=1 Tax=unclassified Saccharothrix TaxID=2593673 RepID=UPI00345BA27B